MRDEMSEDDPVALDLAVQKREIPDSPSPNAHAHHAPPVMMLGVPFHPVNMTAAVARIEAMIQSRTPHHIATANVDFLVQTREDAELHRILLQADLVLCDSTPLLWASRLLGNPLPQRVAGSDLVPELLRVAARKRYRLFFLGGEPAVADKAMELIRRQHPGLLVAGHYSPPFRPLHEMDHDDICRRIEAAQPDVLCVSFGCPKAEKWIALNHRRLGVPVSIGIGATIDFLAGRFRRAPLWMQRSGLEWACRLLQEPRRLGGRYWSDLWQFAGMLLTQERSFPSPPHKHAHGPGAHRVPGAPGEQFTCINAPAQLGAHSLARDRVFWECVNAEPTDCIVNLASVRTIDGAGLGLLVQLHNGRQRSGRQLVLLACSQPVRTALKSHRLKGWFTCAADLPDALQQMNLSLPHELPA